MRPVLVPATRRLWRDPSTLQLGWSSRAVVVEGLGPTSRPLLGLLDGVRTREQVVTEAVLRGYDNPEPLLEALEGAGLLLDADVPVTPGLDRADRDRLAPDLAALALVRGPGAAAAFAARRRARVVVQGAGRVGAALSALLSESGVGTVDVRDPAPVRAGDVALVAHRAEDMGRPRGEALAARLRSEPSKRVPDLVVLTDDAPADVLHVLLRDGVPHLLARVEGPLGQVGPLVLPGASACLRCVDLVRTAVDPAWPALAAQLEHAGPSEACDVVLAVSVAATAAQQALALLEGDPPATVGGSLELELPGWRWRRRTWPQHPGCGCRSYADGRLAAAG